jgi:heat shock protein HslJ
MNHQATLLLISAVIIALLFAGCMTQPQTLPATTPAPLNGTWTLISALAGVGATNVIPGTTITATFSEGGTVSGSTGCNDYVASCQVRENQVKIGKPATSTTKCESPVGIMDQETIYLADLQGAASYAINGDSLTISDSAGKVLLTYQKSGSVVTPLPISGITWVLERYHQVSGTDVPVIQDTELTALFGPIGALNGTAGCNSYNGAYTTSGPNGISFGPLATTRMYCGDAGVMDQETAYLTLLRTVSSYEMTGEGMLHLLDATGTPVLLYSS